ncbi:MAG TPA: type IV toxin-antitoxin system AbiEi family antitoxin domain-containing protein [Gaiellaceae bacterium]|jgi:predicted transcriptional regulator of viral defense system
MVKKTRHLQLLNSLTAVGKDVFETKDVQALAGSSPQAASNLLSRWVRDGLVDRVARGRFALRPIGALGTRAASEDVALAVGATFVGRSHRIAFRSALEYHGLLQHPARRIIVATDTRPSLETISGRPLRAVFENPKTLDLGALDAGYGARVSSVERALLEAAARPELAGGIETVATALAAADVDPHVLQKLANELGARAALHRLGSIAEALEIEPVAAELEPMNAWGRLIQLDPDVEVDVVDGDDGRWRHNKWGVEWPFSVVELEETVRR